MRYFGRASAHGIKGGLFSFMQGGKFEQGFFSGMASSASAPLSNGQGMGARVAFGAVVGGTVEEIGGGKFANGAVTGSFTVLFNEMLHEYVPTKELAEARCISMTNGVGYHESQYYVLENADGTASYYVFPNEDCLPENCPLPYFIRNGRATYDGKVILAEYHFAKQQGSMDIVSGNGDGNACLTIQVNVTHTTIGIGSWTWTPLDNNHALRLNFSPINKSWVNGSDNYCHFNNYNSNIFTKPVQIIKPR